MCYIVINTASGHKMSYIVIGNFVHVAKSSIDGTITLLAILHQHIEVACNFQCPTDAVNKAHIKNDHVNSIGQ